MIHVVAILTTQPGKREEVLKEFHDIVPLVHAETGCIEYQPVVDCSESLEMQSELGSDTFIVIEKWVSNDALKAHSVAPHMAEYGKRVGALIAKRSIHVLENSQ